MLDVLNVFTWVVQIIAFITAAAIIFVIITDPTEEIIGKDERVGHQSAKFLSEQIKYSKWIAVVLLVLGWFFGDPSNMGAFPGTFKTVGICWLIIGTSFMLTFIYGVVRKGKFGKSALSTLKGLGITNVLFGIFMTILSYLLWGGGDITVI